MRTDFDTDWDKVTEEVVSGLKEWRVQHPRASLREIEEELDERMAKMRARLLQDAAMASAAADMRAAQGAERPVCAVCGEVLVERAVAERRLVTHGNQEIKLTRSYGVCPKCGTGFFPPG